MKKNKIFGLDILKAIAIISIVIYHINANWLRGGFVGVDLFFVISGYLLTNSIIRQVEAEGEIKLLQNIIKRIKQLFPVLFLVVFFTTVYITVFNKPILDYAHRDIVPSLTFTNNWWYIFNDVGYFDSFVTSPFKHLWYISVLMQSYIIILLLAKISTKLSDDKFRFYKYGLGIIILASFTASQLHFDIDNVSRVYYGTDTRIFEIAIGALAYFFYPLELLKTGESKKGLENKFLLPLSFISLSLFIASMFYVTEIQPWVYRVGFLLFAINSFALMISVGNDNNFIFNKLRFIPFLQKIGNMSYSIYLWHFPILVLSQTQGEGIKPNLIYVALRVLSTILISLFTYTYIEKPIKKTRKSRARTRRQREKNRHRKESHILERIALGLGVIFVLGMFGIGIPYVSTAFVDTTRELNLPSEVITNAGTGELEGFEIINSDEETSQETTTENTESTDENNQETVEENSNTENTSSKYKNIVLVGDSISINVSSKFKDRYPNAIIDGKVSRQLYKSADVVAQYSNYDSEDGLLIIMLGTNGTFQSHHIDNLVASFPKSKKMFVNVNMPDSWRDQVNNRLAQYKEEHPGTILVDWYSASKDHPEYFAKDDTHLMNSGVEVLVNLMIEAMEK